MKYLLTIIAVLALAVSAYATDLARVPFPILSGPNSPAAIQFFAPDGSLTKTLSVASQTISLPGYILYGAYSGSGTCFKRLMPLSTSTKALYTQVPVPNALWHVRAVNVNTPFANFSGCVGGFVQIQ
jgi:hypothetical protein